MQKATFGGGCFWCTEAIFQIIKGVEEVTSGYMGGTLKHPTYMEISNGDTGHAEVIQIIFNDAEISYTELLLIFFKTHNPTTLNRQGNNMGSQFRSVIFYHSESQKIAAEKVLKMITNEHIFQKPVITKINPATNFYRAEDYHQNYFSRNQSKPFCTFVIQPKMDKLVADFKDKLKSNLSLP